MQEALSLGFIEQPGKKTEVTSVRLTHDALHAVDALAGMNDKKRSEWLRDVVIEKLMELKRQHEYLSKAFGDSTNTLNTSYTSKTSPVGATTELERS
ncbi:hypothetical protein [Acinetobacter wanghuae]|nr:hypothetical protein [Acinetobacter wanghuae]